MHNNAERRRRGTFAGHAAKDFLGDKAQLIAAFVKILRGFHLPYAGGFIRDCAADFFTLVIDQENRGAFLRYAGQLRALVVGGFAGLKAALVCTEVIVQFD